jgi:hypothetical protein
MGQAKLRGTKAERVAEGVRKSEERERLRQARDAARWQRMTPKQRIEYVELVGLIAALTGANQCP